MRHAGGKTQFLIPSVQGCLCALFFCCICACAIRQQDTLPPQWQCNAQADAAVEKGQWPQALLLHQRLLAQAPVNCLTLYHLGYIFGRMGQRQEEAKHYTQAIDCGYDGDDRLFFNLCMAYSELEHFDQAIDACQRAVKLNPRNADNHFGMGIVFEASGDIKRAEQALHQAVTLDDRHWDARNTLARIYFQQEQFAAARQQISAVLQGAPQNQEALDLLKMLEFQESIQYEQ